jgi:hypothetical protein
VTSVNLGNVSEGSLIMPPNAPDKNVPSAAPVTFLLTAGADASHVWFVPAVGAGLRIGLITVG